MNTERRVKDPSFDAFLDSAADAFETALSDVDVPVFDGWGVRLLARIVDAAYRDDHDPAPCEGSPSSS